MYAHIYMNLACESIRFSSLFAAGDVSRNFFWTRISEYTERLISSRKKKIIFLIYKNKF